MMSKQGIINLCYYLCFLDIHLPVIKKKGVRLHQLQKVNTICHFRITHDAHKLKNAFKFCSGTVEFSFS